MTTSPSVGTVMRDRIFRRVDLPAPFPPTRPTTSPRRISCERSFSAQMVVVDAPRPPAANRLNGFDANAAMRSRSESFRAARAPIVYCLPSPEMLIAISLMSRKVGDGAFDRSEVQGPENESNYHDGDGDG